MPFQSKAQQRFMFSQHPEMAKEWADKTPDISKLPEHVKHMAEGGLAGYLDQNAGNPAPDQEGLQDASVSDFLLPALGAPGMAKAGEAMPGIADALGEAGEISIGRAAPKMEEGMLAETPKVVRFSKGVMGKGTPNEMTIWGVKGAPEEVSKLGFGADPGSIPEHILDKFGIPEEVDMKNMKSPTKYAEGGEVEEENKGPLADSEYGTFQGLKNLLKGVKSEKSDAQKASDVDPVVSSSETPKGYAGGGDVTNAALSLLGAAGIPGLGDIGMIKNLAQSSPIMPQPQSPAVDQSFINQMNMAPNGGMQPPTPPQNAQVQSAPSLSQAANHIQNTASTSPDIYAGIGAPDRAALAQQLLAQKASPGNMLASGAGGLGDAITSAFGKSPTNFQNNIRNAQSQNAQQRLGIMDTERQQKMQDIQAKMAVQESDPNSPFSQGMRQFLQAQGMNVPSGMSAAMLKNTLPDVSKIFESKMLAMTQAGAQGVEAGKALMGETLWEQLKDSLGLGGKAPEGESYLEKRIGGASSAANTGGWKVVR